MSEPAAVPTLLATYQRLTPEGAATIAPSTAAIADAELMYGHALTARLRS